MSAPGPQGIDTEATALPWRALLQYYIDCIRREGGLEQLIPRSQTRSRYMFTGAKEEELFSHPERGIEVTDALRDFAASAVLGGETLYYGYPVYVGQDRSTGATRYTVGSLLTVELTLPRPGEPMLARLLPRSDEPNLHPTVMSTLGVKGEQLSRFLESAELGDWMGSRAALAEGLTEIIGELRVPTAERIDPAALSVVTEGAIESTGLHNLAMIFRGSSSEYTRRLLDELGVLKERGSEIGQTAAAALLGQKVSANVVEADPPLLVCPIAANDAQRTALESSLTKPVTVVTGPPGTGKSQLVTNIVASAWAANNSVLVVSTNNGAVDVACKRAAGVHPGMIIRTGSKEYREKAKDTLISLRGPKPGGPDLRATRIALETGARTRRELEQQLTHRTQIETRLAEVLLGQKLLRGTMSWPSAEKLQHLLRQRIAPRWNTTVERIRKSWLLRKWRVARLGRRLGLDIEMYWEAVSEFLSLEIERQQLIEQTGALRPVDEIVTRLAVGV